MSAPYIYHLTLQTGSARDSYRTEVRDDVIAQQIELIERALEAKRPMPIEGLPGCRLSVDGTARRATFLVWYWHRRRQDPELIVTMRLAMRSGPDSVRWYRELVADSQVPVHPQARRAPAAPWLAARLEPALLAGEVAPQTLFALGDYERCVAWAWIEKHKTQGGASG